MPIDKQEELLKQYGSTAGYTAFINRTHVTSNDVPSYTVPITNPNGTVQRGDLICQWVDGQPVNEFLISHITQDGVITGFFVDGRNGNNVVTYNLTNFKKLYTWP